MTITDLKHPAHRFHARSHGSDSIPATSQER